jgi:hypothetical protein
LSGEEKQVMEAVLLKYGHVFHDESEGTFTGTDMVEHRIITGDAKPIRRAPYRIPFALRGEMERQVKDMLGKGVTRCDGAASKGHVRQTCYRTKFESLVCSLYSCTEDILYRSSEVANLFRPQSVE